MIILGIGEPSKIFTIALATFFPILINSMAGVRQISPVHFEVAHNYGANIWNTFVHVIVPGSLPMVLVGMRIAFNNALVITIALELLAARQGLGVMIWYAWETLRTQDLYATLITIALIGTAANFLLQKLTQAVVPWSTHLVQDELGSS
jgi:ABC-type nitrate/sulfonate/bicarbonate transport system permease component